MDSLLGGRLGRLGFTLAGTVLNAIYWLLVNVVLAAFGPHKGQPGDTVALLVGLGLLSFICALIALVLVVKRLHDLDMSGWHYLWVMALPAAIAALGFQLDSKDVLRIAAGVYLVIWLWLWFWPGTRGGNAYGDG